MSETTTVEEESVMGWAVVQTVAPYHPEGRMDLPETTEFVHWIFETQQDASRYKADRLLAGRDSSLIIKRVNEEAWTLTNLSKKKEKKA